MRLALRNRLSCAAIDAICPIACATMIPAMVVAMLYRRSEYTHAVDRCRLRSTSARRAGGAEMGSDKEADAGGGDARSIDPREVWALVQRGEARLLDLRTGMERRRYGFPQGAVAVSLTRHMLNPQGRGAIYLCQHAVRSKATLRNGAAEVAGGFVAWQRAGLPIERAE
jgi:rhodanese-related sulfurtransferase